MTFPLAEALDRPLASEAEQARWREAFAYANRLNAIEGVPPPSEKGLQVQRWVIEGRLSVDEAVAVLVKHYGGHLAS